MATDPFEKKPLSTWQRRGFLAAGGGFAVSPMVSQAQASGAEKKILVGQIGTAHSHAAGKLAAIRKLSDSYEIVGIVEPNDSQWEKAKKNYVGIARLSEEELFSTQGLRAVAVETDIPFLAETALRCVSRGLHIHLDKPGGISLAEFQELHRVATEQDVVIQMGYMLRYNPAFQFLFEALEKGWLGEIFEVDGVMSKYSGVDERAAILPYPGGVMFELACHLVDAVIIVLGPPQTVHSHLRKTLPELDQAVDHGLAVFEYPKAVATVRTSLVEVGGNQRRQLIVCGTKGTVEIRPLEPPSLILTLLEATGPFKKGPNQVDLRKMTGRYDDEFRDLARIIRGEKKADYSSQHDIAVFQAVLQASGMFH